MLSMWSSFRTLALVGGCALLPCALVNGADDDDLPPEPATGEWLEDRLDDDHLWFASSGNLGFQPVARELTDYPTSRRWVRVVDGKPAWVMYYVPGEILGFEVDTHHFGAQGTDFQFAAGSDWRSLTPVDADYEEIVAFEAKWLRLYRAAEQLPDGTRFLKIEFPAGADVEAARLTEVWLRCRFEEISEAAPSSSSAAKPTQPATLPANRAASFAPEVEPVIVRGIILEPPPMPRFGRTAVTVDPAAWPIALESGALLPLEIPAMPVAVEEVPPATTAPKESWIQRFFLDRFFARHRGPRSK
jgi:hypothetical protein